MVRGVSKLGVVPMKIVLKDLVDSRGQEIAIGYLPLPFLALPRPFLAQPFARGHLDEQRGPKRVQIGSEMVRRGQYRWLRSSCTHAHFGHSLTCLTLAPDYGFH